MKFCPFCGRKVKEKELSKKVEYYLRMSGKTGAQYRCRKCKLRFDVEFEEGETTICAKQAEERGEISD